MIFEAISHKEVFFFYSKHIYSQWGLKSGIDFVAELF